jgi:hypothetical protein
MSTEIITLGVIALLVFIGLVFWAQSKRGKLSEGDQKRLRTHWKNIEKECIQNPKGALLEADKLLDEALRLKGYQGSLGEKLKASGPLFSNINGVWTAHKLRNRIAHELDMQLTPTEAESALQQFKKALKDLGVNL